MKEFIGLYVFIVYIVYALLSYRYQVTDLTGQRQFLIDLKLSACFDDGEPCQQIIPILKNYLVTKPQCAWYTGFVQPGEHNIRENIHENEIRTF